MKTTRFARLIMCGLLALGTSAAFGQEKKPAWTSGYFKELDNTYIETVKGEGPTESAARDNAANTIVQRRNLTTGQTVKVTVTDGKLTTSGGELINVKARIVDEYTERDGNLFYVYLLVQTAKNVDNDFELVNVTDAYPFSARCLVPGMQQLYKGQTAKGVAFIAGEVACVGGIIVGESLRADYSNKAAAEHNARNKTTYIDNANTMQNVRNICIGAAAAVYVWNVVDALVSKGNKHVVLAHASLAPYASGSGFGLALNYSF